MCLSIRSPQSFRLREIELDSQTCISELQGIVSEQHARLQEYYDHMYTIESIKNEFLKGNE